MKTFDELKKRTTPDIIKQFVEFAEGFELDTDGNNIGIKDPFDNFYYFEDDIPKNMETFPLLLHRAVEGFNKINEPTGNYGLYIDREKITYCNFKLPRNEEKIYYFKELPPLPLNRLRDGDMGLFTEYFTTGGER